MKWRMMVSMRIKIVVDPRRDDVLNKLQNLELQGVIHDVDVVANKEFDGDLHIANVYDVYYNSEYFNLEEENF